MGDAAAGSVDEVLVKVVGGDADESVDGEQDVEEAVDVADLELPTIVTPSLAGTEGVLAEPVVEGSERWTVWTGSGPMSKRWKTFWLRS
jgi:hypothetical protein